MAITPSASCILTVRIEINKRVAPAVAREVVKAAHRTGVARRERRPSPPD